MQVNIQTEKSTNKKCNKLKYMYIKKTYKQRKAYEKSLILQITEGLKP